MDYRIKQLLKSKMVPAILSIILGIVIIIARRAAVDLLVKIVGGLVIAGGAALIAVYMTRKDKNAGDLKMVLLLAAATVLVGIALIVLAESIVDIFPILIGIYLILNGMSHMAVAFVEEENRVAVGLMGLLVIIMGIMIVCRPGFLVDMIMVFIGASMIVNGAMDLLVLKRFRGELR